MLLKTIKTEFRNTNNARCVKTDGIFKCDHCATEFVRRYSKLLEDRHHSQYCSQRCQHAAFKVGGAIHESNVKTWRAIYGVDNPSQASSIKEKKRLTCSARHGVDSVFNIPFVRAQSNSQTSLQKRHNTMKRNGSYGKSQVEERFAADLSSRFEIQRQVRVHLWEIDFYVKNTDTYVQFDGVYWHGLDRPIEVIAEHRTLRDVNIHRTWLRDQEQNEWFRAHGMRLVRVTDRDFKRGVKFDPWR